MTLTLYVDGPRWRSHLSRTAAETPGLVPVAKGNGYGFGVPRLARRTEWLGADTVAVGTYDEVAEVDRRFSGSVLVMQPWRPFGHDDASTERAFLRDEHACHAAAPKLAGHGVSRAKGCLELLPKLPLPARVRGTHLLTVPPSDAVVR